MTFKIKPLTWMPSDNGEHGDLHVHPRHGTVLEFAKNEIGTFGLVVGSQGRYEIWLGAAQITGSFEKPEAARDAAQKDLERRILSNLEEAELADLDARMTATGMIPATTILSGEVPLRNWMAHVGVQDIESFGQWLMRRYEEILVSRAPYELGEKSKDDELYEWILGHAGAFSEVVANFRQARERSKGPSVDAEILAKAYMDLVDPNVPWVLALRRLSDVRKANKAAQPESQNVH